VDSDVGAREPPDRQRIEALGRRGSQAGTLGYRARVVFHEALPPLYTRPNGLAPEAPTADVGPRRTAVRRAVGLTLRAEEDLAEAGSVIATGYLRLDREEWIRVVEKRSAALGR
jgi:hypothetical protein